MEALNELALFAGAGGGILGGKLLGWRTIGYVEYEKYCQKILKQRIADGILDATPIFGDIRSFISEGYAERYRGMVDVITAGFPCQPFSVAGKQAGEYDPRNMWPATLRCIRLIRPRYAFLENVPGLISSGYFGTVLGGLAEIGYDARWCVLGADDCGAPHRRKRLWILAYSKGLNAGGETGELREAERRPWRALHGEPCGTGGTEDVSDSQQPGLERLSGDGAEGNEPRRIGEKQNRPIGESDLSWWSVDPANWKTESRLGRMADGVADWVDRIKAIGNGEVPIVAATAWKILTAN